MRSVLLSVVCLLITGSLGCAARQQQLQGAQAAYFGGDLSTAQTSVRKLIADDKSDANVLQLDEAMIQLVSGNPHGAEQILRRIRNEFDHLQQTSVAEEAVSVATDDTRRAYAGEDYERLLIRQLLALCSLMQGGQDAHAYVLQGVELQERLLSQSGTDDAAAQPAFQRVALGPYIRAALLEEKHQNYDDITRSRVQVVNWQTGFRDGKIDLARAKSGRHSPPGHGVLYVFTLVGRGPYKEEVAEQPTSSALLIADRILSATGKHTLPPTIAPVKVSAVRESDAGPTGVQVRLNGTPVGTTTTITDVGRLAVQQYDAIYPRVVARAVVRRILKKGAVVALKEKTGADQDPLLDFALNVGGVAWEATEKADTRCWHLLPDRFQVLRIEIPAGTHDITLQSQLGKYPAGTPASQRVSIHDGRNTYLLACFPDDCLVGKILTSESPDPGH